MTAGAQDGEETDALVRELASLLGDQGAMLAAAESCTGGLIAARLTSVAGSSAWFERGFVTYSNLAKREQLDVSEETLARFGAVSEQTARAMAEGALTRSHAHVSLAVTGVAGPGGGSTEKPVGTVWFAWAARGRETRSERARFNGDRAQVREQAARYALIGLKKYLERQF